MLGQRLADLRQLAGDLSSRELDRLAGVAEGYGAMIEAGTRTNVGAAIVCRYARVLGVSVDYLLVGTRRAPSARAVIVAVSAARQRSAA